MRLTENQARALFAEFGIPMPPGQEAATPAEAARIAADLGFPAVVKAQVLSGGRGKAGGIRIVRDGDEAALAATDILGLTIHGERCDSVLVVTAADVAQELYAAITVDPLAGCPVLMFSAQGGVDIETSLDDDPDRVRRLPLSPHGSPKRHEVQDLVRQAGVRGAALPAVAEVLGQLAALFFGRDCLTAEINPLAVTVDGICLALDAKVVIDDAALARQGLEQTDTVPVSDLEKRAAAIGVNYVFLGQGRAAVIAGGAGLAMATMDEVNDRGIGAASFLDTGGGISSGRTAEALRLSLAAPGVAGVLVNIFGGINDCAEVARGIATVVDEDRPAQAVVVKMRGHSQDEGWALLEGRGVPVVRHGTTREAVELLAASIPSSPGDR